MLEFIQRKRRSGNPREATTYALEASCERGGFDAMTVADREGRVIASFGDLDLCVAMAAKAPSIDQDTYQWQGLIRLGANRTVDAIIGRVPTDEGNVYLCATGGDSARLDSELAHVAQIVMRLKPR
jgi:hypothetical protein